jgi:hypothetical protein
MGSNVCQASWMAACHGSLLIYKRDYFTTFLNLSKLAQHTICILCLWLIGFVIAEPEHKFQWILLRDPDRV